MAGASPSIQVASRRCVDAAQESPTIDPVAFPDGIVDPFWTSTQLSPGVGVDTMVIQFVDGTVVNSVVATLLRIRCVR